jgi:beta-lactamase regulating signal transducer with metallopeptidase domain
MMLLLWDAAIKVSAVLSVALLAVFLLRRRPAALRHWILSGAIVCAAIAPVLSRVIPAALAPAAMIALPGPEDVVASLSWDGRGAADVAADGESAQSATPENAERRLPPPAEPPPAAAMQTPVAAAETGPETADSVAAAPPAVSQAVSVQSAIEMAWLAGVVVFLALLAAGSARLAWISARSHTVLAEPWIRIASELSSSYGLRRRVRLRQSRHPWILATWGMVRPEILLPSSAPEWSEERIRVVLAHELAHIRRWDWPFQVAGGLLRSVYWFNPLAWVAHSLLRRESEQACDDMVILQGMAAPDYASHLLALARSLKSGSPWAPVLLMARRSTLQRRVAAMLNPRINRTVVPRSAAVAVLVLLAVITLPIAAFRAAVPAEAVVPGIAVLVPALETATAVEAALLGAMPQQPAPAGQAGSIGGIVVRLGTAEPVAGAFVELRKIDCGESGVPAEVYTALTGRPNPYWVGTAPSAPPQVFTATAGAGGRFEFPNLGPGNYCIVAYRPNSSYFPAEYQQRGYRGRGVTMVLAEGQQMQDVRLALIPGGSISGRVFDGNGEPVAHARIQALEPFYFHGQLRLNPVINLQTNDLGEFRLFWLRPGRYYVAATLEDPQRRTFRFAMYPPGRGGRYEELTYPVTSRRELEDGSALEDSYAYVYYGGGVDMRRAVPIDVAPGASVGGIDIPLGQGRLRSWHVRGVVLNGVTGQPASNVSLRLLPRQWTPHPIVPSAASDANGNFDIGGVVPGDYQLFATGRPAAGRGQRNTIEAIPVPELIASHEVQISGADLNDLRIVIHPGFDLPGQITIEGRSAAESSADLAQIRVRPFRDPDIIGQPQALLQREPPPADATGAFVLNGIGPGNYLVFVEPVFLNPYLIVPPPPAPQSLQDVYLKSMRLGNADVLEQGLRIAERPDARLEVVLAQGAQVRGRVLDAAQQGVVNATVALVPELPLRRRLERYRIARTDTSGRFLLRGVPPGEYRVFAWTEVEDGSWLNADFLRPYENRGTTVRVQQSVPGEIAVMVISR